MSSATLTEALAYAERGWAVIPNHSIVNGACTCGKTDCKPGKHPRITDWTMKASTDAGMIRSWWAKWPNANVGVATGRISGIVALDVDPDHGGAESIHDLEHKHGRLPACPENLTGGGGVHHIFQHPDQEIGNSASSLPPGVDFRGDGGQIIVEPSAHISGNSYVWDVEHHPDRLAPPPMPDWLLELLTGKPGDNGHRPAEPIGNVIVEGARDATLTSLAGSMRRRGVNEGVIFAALLAVNEAECDPPLSDEQVCKIARSVAGYPPAPAKSRNLTDLGNAERLIDRHQEEIRYCYRPAGWYAWDGHRWAPDASGALWQLAAETVRSMYEEAARIEDGDKRKALVDHARRSETDGRLTAMIHCAQAFVQIAHSDFDRDPWAFNCLNGTLALKTGELHPHRREDLISKLSPVAFDPGATCPRWITFLEEILGGDDDLIRYLQRVTGHALSADVSNQTLYFLFGAGANGKTTYISGVRAAFGEYGSQGAPDLLTVRNFPEHPTIVADLAGVRFLSCAEVGEGKRLAETLLKQLTGGDVIKARRMHKDYSEWTPTHKIFLSANHKPVIKGTDLAIWRRIRLIPFTITIPPERQDPHLGQRLAAEAPGILNWLLEGCLLAQEIGFQPPESVLAATEQYREQSDILGEFLAQCCETDRRFEVERKALNAAYTAWCEREGEKPVSSWTLATALRERGFGESPSHRKRVWSGIRLSGGQP